MGLSVLKLGQGTRQTDGWTNRHRPSFYKAPFTPSARCERGLIPSPYGGRGHNNMHISIPPWVGTSEAMNQKHVERRWACRWVRAVTWTRTITITFGRRIVDRLTCSYAVSRVGKVGETVGRCWFGGSPRFLTATLRRAGRTAPELSSIDRHMHAITSSPATRHRGGTTTCQFYILRLGSQKGIPFKPLQQRLPARQAMCM